MVETVAMLKASAARVAATLIEKGVSFDARRVGRDEWEVTVATEHLSLVLEEVS